MLIYFLMIRVTPLMRAKGFLPRLIAALGTFVGNTALFLPVVPLSLAVQLVSNALIFGGTLMAIGVLLQLGTAFAIMPEARRLETKGPYALVRHPLYVVEAIILLGTILQFQQPWAIFIWLIVLVLQYSRSVFEEQVLLKEYPQYREYQKQTRRFIPGLF
jgi:protein-S-isoprenylcysteine O-methyltransferase Ste14